jgi:hypothetical protein
VLDVSAQLMHTVNCLRMPEKISVQRGLVDLKAADLQRF